MASTINASTSAGLVSTADTSGVLQLQTAGTTAVTVDTSGNLGIGTTSPATKLDVVNAANRVARLGGFQFSGTTSSADGGNNLLGSGVYWNGSNLTATQTSGAVVQLGNGTVAFQALSGLTAGSTYSYAPQMTLDASGRFGLGTTTPDSIFGIGNIQTGIRFFYDRATYANIFGGFNHLGDSGGFELYSINNSTDRSIRFSNGASYAGRAERARIDSSGNLGLNIVPSAWSNRIAFESNYGGALSFDGVFLQTALSSNCYYNGSNWIYKLSTWAATRYETGDVSNGSPFHKWYTAPAGTAGNAITFTQAMTLNANGNLLIGTTSDVGSATKLQVNGNISLLNTTNSINCHYYTTVTNGFIQFYIAYNNSDPRIVFYGGTGSNLTYNTNVLALYPGTDGGLTLGTSSFRWGQIYSTSGSISTSDAREKEQVEELNEAELRVAKKLKTLIRKFKWSDAVKKKGDAARIHVGIIAQDVQTAFESEGLDAHQYGIFCYDSSWVRTEEVDDLKTGEKVIQKILCSDTEEGAICETRYGVRYEELLAFIIASM
jgi:hypothetical protein